MNIFILPPCFFSVNIFCSIILYFYNVFVELLYN
uniref:Uncharacterized protein n=1 Tax=Siphoviridae sp. cttuu15 TaxID=2825709 RepID=A0A8S5U1B4_9CAUD|nr:MAG TPA: hypothetical protein [Siphoviridae sp. cttuu15]